MRVATDKTSWVLETIRAELTLRNSAALAQTVSHLIVSGRIPVGTRLPTVRTLAEELGMSPSAVGQSWRYLATRRLVKTSGRGGTWALGRGSPPQARRYESMLRRSTSTALDLGNLRSDTMQYPDLRDAMSYAASLPTLHHPFSQPILEELELAVRPTWSSVDPKFLATHGLIDALELALSSIASAGDYVVLENPTHGRVYDILEAMNVTPLPVTYHVEGPDIAELRKAMISKPVAFIYQPQGSAPSGRSITREWVRSAAPVIQGMMPILELSQASLLYDDTPSLGSLLPKQVAQIRSYNFFFGSDLRLAVTGGNPDLVNTMWARLTYSSRFVSRILQGVLAHYLTNPQSIAKTKTLISEVRRRHRLLQEALMDEGFEIDNTAGPSIWLPVPDEHSVCARLGHDGIAVYPGKFFLAETSRLQQRIHINSAFLSKGHHQLAKNIAGVCSELLEAFRDSGGDVSGSSDRGWGRSPDDV